MASLCHRVTTPPPIVVSTRAIRSTKMRTRRLRRFHMGLGRLLIP